MATLGNSSRQLLKATYAPISVDQSSTKLSHAQPKAALVRGLQLQAGEVAAVQAHVGATGSAPIPTQVWTTLKQFEPQPVAALAPKASALADIPVDQLRAFAQATLDYRTEQLRTLQRPPAGQPPASSPVPIAARAPSQVLSQAPSQALDNLPPLQLNMSHLSTEAAQPAAPAVPAAPAQTMVATLSPSQASVAAVSTAAAAQHALAASLVTFAKGALDTFTKAVTISPIGMLHLERIEMEPAGIERGELVATIPLAPSETTSVTQKEWSVTSQEFSSIVTDYLENYSEKGVTEKSDLAESTDSQTQHSQQLGLNASMSGSSGFVTFSTSASANVSDSTTLAQKQSRDDAKEVTSKASSRTRKEHQVSIQVSSTVGSSETSTRTITNPSTSSAMRIDYFSMMRKWRVRLLQYGVRLTYDLAIPEPGATLRKQHADLADLNRKLGGAFTFTLNPSSITDKTYLSLAAAWGVAVQAPPDPSWKTIVPAALQSSKDIGVSQTLEFDVPQGYRVTRLLFGGAAGTQDNTHESRLAIVPGNVEFFNTPPQDPISTTPYKHGTSLGWDLSDFHGLSGHISIPFVHSYATMGEVFADVTAERTPEAYAAWQQQAWQTLHDAASDAYYTQVQAWTQARDALKAQIEGVDTLTLRREEQDEIMKGVLRWLLGPDFDFMPSDVASLFAGPVGQSFTTNELGLNPDGWSTMFVYGEMVKFIQQAIEWENLLYLVYPYFWDVPTAWEFARTLQHPDPTRQAFLRAGSARVVLTVRSGFEQAFTAFVEKGELGQVLPPDHPYVTIGQEIQAYDQTNYPGIPPANPDPEPRPLLTPLQRQAWQDLQAIMALLEKGKAQYGRYPTTTEGLGALAGLGTVPAADPWGRPYQYQSPGKYDDYDLASYGANGVPGGEGDDADITSWADASLIAEWYEYTPTHGLDIAVTSNLPDMA